MSARRHHIAKVVHVWRAETVPGADGSIVHPNLCLPVTAFQEQDNSPARPVLRNVEPFLIPGRAYVMFHGGQPEGNFYRIGLSVLFILGVRKPRAVHNLPGPFRIDGNIVAIAVLRDRAGQLDAAGRYALVPLLLFADVLRVQPKEPLAC
ncbi:hypothetical protein ES703_62789 [subsurface metagenome]